MSVSFVYPAFLWLLLVLPLVILLGIAAPHTRTAPRYWLGMVLRCLLLVALILSIAGIQVRLDSNQLTTIFLLDVSDSLSSTEQERGESFIQQALTEMKGGDQASVIVFGEDALVERLATDDPILDEIRSIPVSSRTDIAEAIQLAFALFPGEGARRIVLLSDGRENMGTAIEQADYAAASQIELTYLPLGEQASTQEVYLDRLDAPSEIRSGQDLELVVLIESTTAAQAGLRIFADGTLIQTSEIRLLPGRNEIRVPVKDLVSEDNAGFRRFEAQILPDNDTNLQNNQASAFTIILGPPAVLVVEGKPGDGESLDLALSQAEMNVRRISPAEMPPELSGLAEYESVVLVDVPAAELPQGVMDALEVYVRDLGKGLVMVGGPQSFGAGGYLRTPLERTLPVDMDVRDKEIQSNLALVLAVDKSGSMGRCHCDDPDLNQSYTPQQSGQPKVDIAKEAVMRAASALGDQDYLGVMAFDSQPHWAVELSQLVDPLDLERSISAIQADGQTNLQAGVEAAYQALENVQARRKHIILMTDGWVRTGELNALAQQMVAQGITLSIVAAGEGSAEYLNALAVLGGGEYYPATNSLSVPDFFLKETIKSAGKYIVEGPFYPIQSAPSAVLRGLDGSSLPFLLGYNGTSVKKTARLDLITPQGDPLLASWQYGLGRAAAWTSDLKGQWAPRWLEWDGFARFSAQLVSWTIPTRQVQGLEVETMLEENRAVIQLMATQDDGSPWNFLTGSATLVDPENKSQEIVLKQTGPGIYQAESEINIPGVYLMRVGVNDGDQSLGQSTLGLVVPYSPEYKSRGIDLGLMESLASVTGGKQLAEPASAFIHNLASIPSAHEIWLPLLYLVAFLFPLDVALRRLSVSKKDLAAFWKAMRLRMFSVRQVESAPQPRLLKDLFQARQRVRHRQRPASGEPQIPRRAIGQPPKEETSGETTAVSTSLEGETTEVEKLDSFSRLREAKKRARR